MGRKTFSMLMRALDWSAPSDSCARGRVKFCSWDLPVCLAEQKLFLNNFEELLVPVENAKESKNVDTTS